MSQDELKDSNPTRQKRMARGRCTGGCGRRVTGKNKKCAECLAKEKTKRDALKKAGRCPRCGKKKPKELGLCLKCGSLEKGMSGEQLQNFRDGDMVPAFEKHPTIMKRLARGKSRLRRKDQ